LLASGAATGGQAGAGLDPDREREALQWIETVSEFDAGATRWLVTVAAAGKYGGHLVPIDALPENHASVVVC
jgi:hypothetical protein